MLLERIIEMRGIPRSEIIQYFKGICDEIKSNGKFKNEGWEVEVGQEESCSLGSVKLYRVRILFTGQEDILEKVIKVFNMKFLRGGG